LRPFALFGLFSFFTFSRFPVVNALFLGKSKLCGGHFKNATLRNHQVVVSLRFSGGKEKNMEVETTQQKEILDRTAQSPVTAADGVRCPICQFNSGRLIRGKIYCGNCGFIES